MLLVVLSSFASTVVEAQAICSLCGQVSQLPVRWDYVLSNGQTCQQVYVELAGYNVNDVQW